VNSGVKWLTGAVVAARALLPRVLEQSQAHRYPLNSDGVIVGAEPIDLPRAGAPAVLLLHGGGDTPQSVSELAAFLHKRGYAVRVPLLDGHGRSLQHVRDFDADRWREQARAELRALRDKHKWVALVGQSVGGGLALDLAATSGDVPAMVLLAPWVAMAKPLRMLAATSATWGLLVPYLPSMGGHSIHDPEARAKALARGIVTPAMLRALAIVADRADEAEPHVRAATLTIQSREDERIAASSAQRAFDRIGATDKRMEWTSGSGHVVTVDYGKERVFSMTADWLDAHGGQ
jgi:carboxylesterase